MGPSILDAVRQLAIFGCSRVARLLNIGSAYRDRQNSPIGDFKLPTELAGFLPELGADESGFEVEIADTTSVITEPFDPTLIRIETKPSTINLLVARIKNAEIDFSTGFQRRSGIWSDAAQSQLIESMLIRIPIPAFYVDATDDDRWLVVDGLQRLTAINRFMVSNELKLTGLEFLTKLNGLTYENLPRNFQRRIEGRSHSIFD